MTGIEKFAHLYPAVHHWRQEPSNIGPSFVCCVGLDRWGQEMTRAPVPKESVGEFLAEHRRVRRAVCDAVKAQAAEQERKSEAWKKRLAK